MKKLVIGALALAVAGPAAFADPADSEWLELDREINSLASAVSTQGPIAGYAVLIRSSYTFSSDDLATLGGDDISGFKLEDVRVSAWGEVGDYGWRISYNLDQSVAFLEDAYVFWMCGEYFTAVMGQYKPRSFRTAGILEENQLFIHRTILGRTFDFYDDGVGARGEYNEFAWSIDVMNGGNGQVKDHAYIARAEYRLNGGAGDIEGAYGASDDMVGTIGVMYFNSDVINGDAQIWGVDIAGTQGLFSVAGELSSWGDDVIGSAFDIFRLPGGLGIDADTTPWALTISYLISMELEAALRYQDTDNDLDQNAITLALIYYHAAMLAKWNFEVSQVDGDDPSPGIDGDATVFQVGVSVGNSR
jgi:hypothetical protein